MARTTKSPFLAERRGAGQTKEGTEVGGCGNGRSGGGDCCGDVEYAAVGVGDTDVRDVGGRVGVGIERLAERPAVDKPPQPGGNDDATGGVERFITAVISLSFVAAPGRAAPEPRVVEYRMDLSSRHGWQDVAVFLGEVDYNDAGGAT